MMKYISLIIFLLSCSGSVYALDMAPTCRQGCYKGFDEGRNECYKRPSNELPYCFHENSERSAKCMRDCVEREKPVEIIWPDLENPSKIENKSVDVNRKKGNKGLGDKKNDIEQKKNSVPEGKSF